MKKLLFLLMLVSANAFAQDGGWFEVGATWTYQYTVNGWLEDEVHTVDFAITEETTLNGQTCMKMEVVSEDTLTPFMCLANLPPYYFYESNDSIFYASDYDTNFNLVYDFGAQAGDTWDFTYPVEVSETYTGYVVSVDSTSTMQQDGIELKVMYLDYEIDSYDVDYYSDIEFTKLKVIEKMGVSPRFVIPIGQWVACEGPFNIKLRCYSDSEINYLNPEFASCVLGVNDVPQDIEVDLYPNPAAHGSFAIATSGEVIQEVVVYSTLGSLVYHSGRVNALRHEVNIADMAAGLYTVVIQTDRGTASKKLVVE